MRRKKLTGHELNVNSVSISVIRMQQKRDLWESLQQDQHEDIQSIDFEQLAVSTLSA